jgi:hypothetical protein
MPMCDDRMQWKWKPPRDQPASSLFHKKVISRDFQSQKLPLNRNYTLPTADPIATPLIRNGQGRRITAIKML